jgi:hypothetical protein
MALQNKLKAFVRFDGSGRVIPSSLILQKSKPKVGNWKEINATQCCDAAPTTTTTTTTISVGQESAVGNFNSVDACSGTGNSLTVYYNNSTPLGVGTALYTDAGLTSPYSPGSFPSGNGTYLRIYFQAQDQVCTMSGNVIQSYTAC